MKSGGKLLMAFDCLKDQGADVRTGVSTARALAAKLRLSASAVAVVSPEQLLWPRDFTSEWIDEFQEIGLRALSSFLRRSKITNDIPSKILMQPLSSKRENVDALLKEAGKSKACMIAVFTHTDSKKSWRLPGRFISSLVSYSSIPILALNASAPAVTSFKTILVATDFSAEGARTFLKACALAKEANARILLVHVWSVIANESLGASAGLVGGWVRVQDFLQKEEADLQKQGKRWVVKARSTGISADFQMISNPTGTVRSILKAADRNSANLVVVTEKTGPWASVFLGSVTREIIADSRVPVLIFPARAKKKRK